MSLPCRYLCWVFFHNCLFLPSLYPTRISRLFSPTDKYHSSFFLSSRKYSFYDTLLPTFIRRSFTLSVCPFLLLSKLSPYSRSSFSPSCPLLFLLFMPIPIFPFLLFPAPLLVHLSYPFNPLPPLFIFIHSLSIPASPFSNAPLFFLPHSLSSFYSFTLPAPISSLSSSSCLFLHLIFQRFSLLIHFFLIVLHLSVLFILPSASSRPSFPPLLKFFFHHSLSSFSSSPSWFLLSLPIPANPFLLFFFLQFSHGLLPHISSHSALSCLFLLFIL